MREEEADSDFKFCCYRCYNKTSPDLYGILFFIWSTLLASYTLRMAKSSVTEDIQNLQKRVLLKNEDSVYIHTLSALQNLLIVKKRTNTT